MSPSAPPTDPAPGAAARAYLPYGRHPGPLPQSPGPLPPATLVHADRPTVPLPWEPADGPPDWPAVLGTLMRELLGRTRANWMYPVDPATGTALAAPPGQGDCRPAPSGGARYPIEAYLALGAAPGRPAAVYHYDGVGHRLVAVRPGDHRTALAPGTGEAPDLVLVLTAVFWRSAVKYREFGYRLQQQETGVLLAQAQTVAESLGATVGVRLRQDDRPVDALLGLDPYRQSVTAVLTLRHPAAPAPGPGPGSGLNPSPSPAPGPGEPPSAPSAAAVPVTPPTSILGLLPYTAAVHGASLAERPDAVQPARPVPAPGAGPAVPLPDAAPLGPAGLRAGVARRASASNGFLPVPMDRRAVAAVLGAAAAGYPGDLAGVGTAPAAVALCCVVRDVTGLTAGCYAYRGGELVPLPVPPGAPERIAAGLAAPPTRLDYLEAPLTVLPVAALEAGIDVYGDRWYRLAHIEAGLALQRAALAAAALGLSARIRSDASCAATDEALGLPADGLTSLSALHIGTPRPGPTLGFPV
ncbi:SagB/ThcOx family dehydrogenase [Kitasatospora sp. NPDC098652]|uniref:SagB/ThcOx family dehydrogenase n=1 Tax=Kitasatospora sp. NPDC098652 TaxID=3364095 RepID=UPI003801FBEF